jgi:hypothetical protein
VSRRERELRRGLRRLRLRQIRQILQWDWPGITTAGSGLPILADIRRMGDPARSCLLDSPLLGCWVQDLLFWRRVLSTATLLSERGTEPLRRRLFDLIAQTEYLVETVPRGHLDARFARRARLRAREILAHRWLDLPRTLWPHLPLTGKRRLRFPMVENTDEGCPGGRVRLGLTPAMLIRPGGNKGSALTGEWKKGSLVLPAGVRLGRHEAIPGTSILLAHRLLSGAGRLRVGDKVRGLAKRLAGALQLVDRAWPAAGEEIRRRTWLVVPLVEPGTVSYSLLARPGISYINVFRGSLLDLADDLLHETAHHRLHAWQEVAALARPGGDPPSFYSPWRRALRPLNGILHGTYTFLFRAELFLRIGRVASLAPSRDRWLRREAHGEIRNCGRSLDDLGKAARAGWLTPEGENLLRSMRRHHQKLRVGSLSDGRQFSIF